MSSFYEKNHQQYFESTTRVDPSDFLDPLVKILPSKATVLDIGCGSGRDLRWLRERGYRAIGFEQSPSLADLACKYSGCQVVIGDFCSYDFSKMQANAVLMIGALVHVEHQKLPGIINKTCKGVIPGGIVYLSMKEGNGTQSSEDGRIFSLWQRRELETILTTSGLSVLSFTRTVSKLRDSDNWLSFILRTQQDCNGDNLP